METIWKYELSLDKCQQIKAPAGWKPMSVQLQRNTLCLWAVVDTNNKLCSNKVWLHITGEALPDRPVDRVFVGTIQMPSGIVYHVFAER